MKLVHEGIAVAVTSVAMIAAVSFPFVYENAIMTRLGEDVDRIITLTGVAPSGVWTDEEVHSGNYGSRDFKAARPVLKIGQTVLFRLKSADDTHGFYVPDLGIGPIEVYPGRVAEVRYTADRKGSFRYLCTVDCGPCHFWMKGEIVVIGEGETPPPPPPREEKPRGHSASCPHHITVSDQGIGFSLRGHILFETIGCVTCHGKEGRGGVKNLGYIKETVPELDILAERMMLYEKEDADIVIDLLEKRIPLKSLLEDPPLPRYNVVVAQYDSIRDTIRKGSRAGKATEDSPEPPYHMPRWAERLSDEDIDAIIVYLLDQYPWPEEEEE